MYSRIRTAMIRNESKSNSASCWHDARIECRRYTFLGDAKTAIAGSMSSDINVLYSMAGCMPQRPHADYSPYSVTDLHDDGVCHGLPVGVIIVLQDDTTFDAWPG
jgi:hypothetical protein